ncbi:MAG: NAD(P)H-dependent oxidoreductase [Spongiibacteraceae bacterium]|jgi:FMN reductase|nr:NAD(P)H-dependent oxidoreductase [Spongiibacteraceae bacterium]
MTVVGISGSLTGVSRSTALANALTDDIALRIGGSSSVIRIADHGATLGRCADPRALPAEVAALYAHLSAASVVVVSTPVYKASYTGLFKHFFDLLNPADFRDKLVVLAATGGSEQHALVIEHQLRPLFAFFGALTVPAAVFLADRHFLKNEEGEYLLDAQATERVAMVVEQAVALAGTRSLWKESGFSSN